MNTAAESLRLLCLGILAELDILRSELLGQSPENVTDLAALARYQEATQACADHFSLHQSKH